MFYEISLLLLLLAGRAASTEVINNDNIDQQKHPDVLRLIVTNSSAKVNLRGLTPDTSSGLTSAPLSSGSFVQLFLYQTPILPPVITLCVHSWHVLVIQF